MDLDADKRVNLPFNYEALELIVRAQLLPAPYGLMESSHNLFTLLDVSQGVSTCTLLDASLEASSCTVAGNFIGHLLLVYHAWAASVNAPASFNSGS